MKLFPPSLIAEKLENNLDALPNGQRDLPARQRTLRATLQWSYNLANKAEQILFTNISVLNGGATLDAIEYVCSEHKGLKV